MFKRLRDRIYADDNEDLDIIIKKEKLRWVNLLTRYYPEHFVYQMLDMVIKRALHRISIIPDQYMEAKARSLENAIRDEIKISGIPWLETVTAIELPRDIAQFI